MMVNNVTYDSFIHKLNWVDAVETLRRGHFLPKAEIKDIFLGPHTATLLNRAAYVPGLGYGVKAVTVLDNNAKRNLPTVQGAMLFYDEETGALKLIVENKLVTEIKTASDSVLGAKILARKDSRNLLIVGAGNLASGLIRAYANVFPELRSINIWSRRPEQAEKIAKSFSSLNIPVKTVKDLEYGCFGADIISTSTMSRDPILRGEWIQPGTHIDLIGAYKADMREADDDLLQKGTIYVDSKDTVIHHIGEILIPLKSGSITESDIKGDFYDMVQNERNRKDDQEITIFKNGGGAHLDTMIAYYIYNVNK